MVKILIESLIFAMCFICIASFRIEREAALDAEAGKLGSLEAPITPGLSVKISLDSPLQKVVESLAKYYTTQKDDAYNKLSEEVLKNKILNIVYQVTEGYANKQPYAYKSDVKSSYKPPKETGYAPRAQPQAGYYAPYY